MTPEELTQRLSGVQAKRGYLLPHHGLLAITSPAMLQAYDQLYTALALDHKTLSVRDRELVWLAILVACDEALATHHIARFYEGGGSDADFKAVLQLTASLKGVTAYRFVQNHWTPHLPSIDSVAAYRDAVEHAGQPLSRRDIWLCACSVHENEPACTPQHTMLRQNGVARIQVHAHPGKHTAQPRIYTCIRTRTEAERERERESE